MESEVISDWFFNPHAKNNFSDFRYHDVTEGKNHDVTDGAHDDVTYNRDMMLDQCWSSSISQLQENYSRQHNGSEFTSQCNGQSSTAEQSVLKHLLTDDRNTYKRSELSSEQTGCSRVDRTIDVNEALGVMGWEEDSNCVTLCNISHDVTNDNCLRSLSNGVGYYGNATDIAHVIQSHSPKSAQTLSQLNGSDDVSSLLDDVTCCQAESRDFMTSHPVLTTSSFLDADDSMTDSYLPDLDPLSEGQRGLTDSQTFDDVMCVDEENNNVTMPSSCMFNPCSRQQNIATTSGHDRRPKCSRRRSQNSQDGGDEEDYGPRARERKLSAGYLTPAFTNGFQGISGTVEIRNGNQKVNSCRHEDDGRRMFLEDHRYSSRKPCSGSKSLMRSGSHELPLYTAAGLQKPRGSGNSVSNTTLLRNISSQSGSAHPTSALESFLRARHTLNPNKGSDALLTDSMPYSRQESQTLCSSLVQISRLSTPQSTRTPVLSRSFSVPTTNGTLPSSPSGIASSTTRSASDRFGNTSRLLHRLLTGEADEDDCRRPVTPSSEEGSSSLRADLIQHSSPSEPSPPLAGVLPFADIAKELANDMFDYSLLFNDDIATSLNDDEGSIQFNSDLIDEDFDQLFDVELKHLTYSGSESQQINNRTTRGITTDDSSINWGHAEETSGRKLLHQGLAVTQALATSSSTAAVSASTAATAAATLVAAAVPAAAAPAAAAAAAAAGHTGDTTSMEEEQEIWFMRYFDNLF